ncbi:MAG: apolipoprotein N-acyltransferase, partial [Pikeienuella sp.]
MASVSATIEALAGWRRAFVAIIAGVLWALAHVPFGVWPLIFVAGPLSFWLLRGGFRAGWLIGAVFFAITLHWIVEPFLIDATVFGWMAPFALVGMAGGLGLFWAVAFWAAQRFFPGSAFGLAGCWFMAEAARSYILTGFPWVLPAYIWVDTPVAQLSAMVGPYALSLITLVLAIAAFGLKRMSALASVAAVLAVSWVWGLYVLAAPEKGQTLTVRVVQPNIPQAEKWAPEFQGRN